MGSVLTLLRLNVFTCWIHIGKCTFTYIPRLVGIESAYERCCPCFRNPAVENQAIDRIVSCSRSCIYHSKELIFLLFPPLLQHRLGQTKAVNTYKFIISDSIEARLLEVQKKKTELANMTVGQGFSKSEALKTKMEELNQLFGLGAVSASH